MLYYCAYYRSPIGIIQIKTTDTAVISVEFCDVFKTTNTNHPTLLKDALNQLDEYFNGQRLEFDLNLSLAGTPFQERVWHELIKIPYGEIQSYKQIAIAIGNERACRAVGGANNKNKIAILIPCHRVIGANQTLVGYEGGLERKQWLLDHEKKYKKQSSSE